MTTKADVSSLVGTELADSLSVKRSCLALADIVADAVIGILDRLHVGGRVFLCGNGGSAADSQHIAAELIGRFMHDRRPIPSIALTTDSSVLTALANDMGFPEVFRRQVEALIEPRDVLIAISTSGISPNVIRAAKAARRAGALTVALTGRGGGDLARIVDIAIVVPSSHVARIQEAHIAIGHAMCAVLEKEWMDEPSGIP